MARKRHDSDSEDEGSASNDDSGSEQESGSEYSDSSGSESEEEEEPTTSNKAPKSAHANTNKITQLAYAVNSKVPKGKKKEIARLRRWLTFAKRKVLLTLDDLGEVSPSILQMPT